MPDEPVRAPAVGGDERAVRGHRQAGDRAEVRQHLVAPVGASRQHGGRAGFGGEPGQHPRPGLRRVSLERARLDHVHVGDAVIGQRRGGHLGRVREDDGRQGQVTQAPGQGQRPQRGVGGTVAVEFGQAQDGHAQKPPFVKDADQFRHRVGPVAEHGGLVLARGRHPERFLAQSFGRPGRRGTLDRGALGPQSSGQRRVARQVDAFLDGDHRGQRQLVRLLHAAVLPPGDYAVR